MATPATIADQGLKALNAREYPEAIALYTQAIQYSPNSPDYYLKRSTAYQRSGQTELALVDADLALVLAHQRQKRELIGSAQLRRGICLYLAKRYGDADLCFTAAAKRCSENEKKLLDMWRKKLEMSLDQIPEEDVTREVTIVEIPDVSVPQKPVAENTAVDSGKPVAEKKAADPEQPQCVVTPPSKIRHEWYQTTKHVVLTLYVKGVPKDKATIEISERSLSIAFPLPTGKDYTFDLDPLYYPINPEHSSFSILSTKIEVKLHKTIPGQKWADLEATSIDSSSPITNAAPTATVPALAKTAPSYPTSSKTGPKDWDKVAKEELRKDTGNGEAVDEKEYDSDYDGGDDVNYFFKKLYKDADPDTKRAMMKSYIESNGTALSTNWGEVEKGKVETSPPDGMVAKKWDD
ncbi:Cochaperone protein [Rhizina undulata]